MRLKITGFLLIFVCMFFVPYTFSQESDERAVDSTSIPQVTVPQVKSGNLDMLTPPETFEVATAFNGFLSKKTSSAIIVTLIDDVTFPLIAKGMTDEFYAKNKLTFISESDIKTNSGDLGKLFKLSFNLEEDEYIRYMVYVGDIKKTLWLNITYPKVVEAILEPEILKCIDSVDLNPDRSEK